MEMMSAPRRFSTGGRHFRCQEQHDLNGFHLGEKIALFVCTRGEQWVIASGALIRMGATRNSSRSIGTLSWKSRVKIVEDAFLSRGRDVEQCSLCWWSWRSRRLEQDLTDVSSQHTAGTEGRLHKEVSMQ